MTGVLWAQKDESKTGRVNWIDKKNHNTPNSCKTFHNLQSVFNMLTDSGCGVPS